MLRSRGGDDRGAGTVLVIGIVLGALVLVGVLAVLGRAEGTRGSAQSAADLAALAAAEQLAGSGPVLGTAGQAEPDTFAVARACRVARDVALVNGAELTTCTHLGDGVVRVGTHRALGAGTGSQARATATAGPADVRPLLSDHPPALPEDGPLPPEARR